MDRVETNLYLAKVKAAFRTNLTNPVSETSNQQVELFPIVRNLSRIGLSDGPPPSFSLDQFAAFLKSKVDAILSPFLNTVSQAEMSSAPSCPVTFDCFQPGPQQ